jgi:hypothetical protein
MFRRLGGCAENLAHLDRIERWVRESYGLTSSEIVLVSEEAVALPGFEGRDTTARFWAADGTRYRIRVFKPAAQVRRCDLPVAWLLPGFVDDGDPDCC